MWLYLLTVALKFYQIQSAKTNYIPQIKQQLFHEMRCNTCEEK